jgi:hypothetical protein
MPRFPALRVRAAAAALALLLPLGCASTKLADVWKAPDPGTPPRKVLVVAVVPSQTNRRMMEGELAERLQQRGLKAVSISSLTPEGPPPDRAQVEALVQRDGFDAVIVSRYAGAEDSVEYVPGGPVGNPAMMGFYGYYGALYPTVYTPGAVIQNETVHVETMLYRAQGKGELVWSTTSQTFNPTSPYKAIEDISGAVVSRMAKDKVI